MTQSLTQTTVLIVADGSMMMMTIITWKIILRLWDPLYWDDGGADADENEDDCYDIADDDDKDAYDNEILLWRVDKNDNDDNFDYADHKDIFCW